MADGVALAGALRGYEEKSLPKTLADRLQSIGIDPDMERQMLIPYSDEAGWHVPQIGVEVLKAAMLPRHAIEGGEVTAEDAANFGLTFTGAGLLAGQTKAIPRGVIGMAGGGNKLPPKPQNAILRKSKFAEKRQKMRDIGQQAIDMFGEAGSVKDAGFVTADGRLVNMLSGASRRKPAQGQAFGHQNIADVIGKPQNGPSILEFQDISGAVRLVPEDYSVSVVTKPNMAQAQRIIDMAGEKGDIIFDVYDPKTGRVMSAEIPRVTSEKIMAAYDILKKHLNDGAGEVAVDTLNAKIGVGLPNTGSREQQENANY